MTPPAPVTRLGAQRSAQHELSKSIYHRNAEPFPVRAVHWAGRLVDRVLNDALKHSPGGSLGALALVVVIAVVVIILIWRVGVPQRRVATGAVLPTGGEVSAAEHRARAEAAAGGGDWRNAVIEQMRAVARELEERGILERRAGRTATELAREAGAILPAAAADLQRAAEVFNLVAYGGGEATRAGLDSVAAADAGVRSAGRGAVLSR